MSSTRSMLGVYDTQFNFSPLAEPSAPTSHELQRRYELLIEQGASDQDNMASHLRKLKELILAHGIPEEEEMVDLETTATLRGKVWQILLGVRDVDVHEYLSLLKDGVPEVKNEVPPGSVSMFGSQAAVSKDIIVVDATRTFSIDADFNQRVPFEKIVRVLSAFHRKIQQSSKYMGYIQGMNCLAGCFLYTMPEAEAWASMVALITKMCPRYCGLNGGSYDGDILVRRIIEAVDPTLAQKIALVPLSVFTHQVLQGFCTIYPPLSEILKLWDLMLSFGMHMTTIFTACMIVLRRDEILSAKDPKFFIQKGAHPNTDAGALIRLAVHIIPLIPPKLFALCAVHPWKPLVTIDNDKDPFESLP